MCTFCWTPRFNAALHQPSPSVKSGKYFIWILSDTVAQFPHQTKPIASQVGVTLSDHDEKLPAVNENSRVLTLTRANHFLLHLLKMIVCYMENKCCKCNYKPWDLTTKVLSFPSLHNTSLAGKTSRSTL